MKQLIFMGMLLLASAMSGEAMALCGGGWTRVTNLTATLTGKTACSLTGDVKQEEHRAGGELWDYKCGDADAAVPGTACAKPDIDRRKKLGRWEVQNDNSPVLPNGTTRATVTHIYNAFPSGSVQEVTTGPFSVYTNGTQYDFCKLDDPMAENPVLTSDALYTLETTNGTRRCGPPR